MLLSSDPITVTFGHPASHLLISMANTEQTTFLHIALWLKVCDISNETNDLFYLWPFCLLHYSPPSPSANITTPMVAKCSGKPILLWLMQCQCHWQGLLSHHPSGCLTVFFCTSVSRQHAIDGAMFLALCQQEPVVSQAFKPSHCGKQLAEKGGK